MFINMYSSNSLVAVKFYEITGVYYYDVAGKSPSNTYIIFVLRIDSFWLYVVSGWVAVSCNAVPTYTYLRVINTVLKEVLHHRR